MTKNIPWDTDVHVVSFWKRRGGGGGGGATTPSLPPKRESLYIASQFLIFSVIS